MIFAVFSKEEKTTISKQSFDKKYGASKNAIMLPDGNFLLINPEKNEDNVVVFRHLASGDVAIIEIKSTPNIPDKLRESFEEKQ
jgi:hypothetical protein